MRKTRLTILSLFVLLMLLVTPACNELQQMAQVTTISQPSTVAGAYTVNTVPDFTDQPYVEINNNIPYFDATEYTTKAFESYSPLDSLGRCGVAYACVCQDTMPTEKRGNISSVKPSGWQSISYDFVNGKSLYNRCHLIGFQLTAENANNRNLITGTRYMNTEGMLPFENMVADYVKETNGHVLYRVTPVFDGDNLVARGVEMEAYSVDDKGDSISFNVYVYNNQPGVIINYADGTSHLPSETDTQNSTTSNSSSRQTSSDAQVTEYVVNVNNKKVHLPSCSSVKNIKEQNKKTVTDSLAHLIQEGYTPCNTCLPQE